MNRTYGTPFDYLVSLHPIKIRRYNIDRAYGTKNPFNFHKYIHLFICFTPLITPAIQGKQQNTVVDGVKEGTVDLIAEGSGPHEWRKSTDEKEWTPLPASRTSKTTAKDLKSGELYSFQNRMMLTNDEKTEWSQSVKIRVR